MKQVNCGMNHLGGDEVCFLFSSKRMCETLKVSLPQPQIKQILRVAAARSSELGPECTIQRSLQSNHRQRSHVSWRLLQANVRAVDLHLVLPDLINHSLESMGMVV